MIFGSGITVVSNYFYNNFGVWLLNSLSVLVFSVSSVISLWVLLVWTIITGFNSAVLEASLPPFCESCLSEESSLRC